ncbi:photosynthetic reaction center cytochrome PufC [Hydrogenophaga sp.]|uniref:photosynthetic reaction center cytochrome PufC n=1 Tax=Hydrogenophaga sp. TaxID=1904254 RepID=UPI0027253120|nr:photosynthetic reaction center cytochrome PufC [Hydrogenophaga sp.]MDO8906726.1 photosynthetic reaction center cytochrome PufC [Hydrogenophaga sp.]
MNTALFSTSSAWLKAIALGSLVLLTACERPPMESVQHGYRGTGMVQVYNPRILEDVVAANQVPAALEPASAEGPKAGQIYQNVQVLGDLSIGEFTRLMVAMTAWVSPEQGCNYCHNPANFADDSLYTKVVSRKMVEMTQHINSNWKTHVAETGVTCYTCHRGQPVPKEIWFTADSQPQGSNFIGDKAGQNSPHINQKLGSLPYDPFTAYLLGNEPIRVGATTALPVKGAKGESIQRTEKTYALMTHMSASLGVNCTYCHNTQNFAKWEGAPPQRVTAYHGIQMSRDLNLSYMEPLTDTFPSNRKGELGDVPKLNCATCHQGAYKPLFGAPMAKDHPELQALRAAVAATAMEPAAASPDDAPAAASTEAPAATEPAPATAAPAAAPTQ